MVYFFDVLVHVDHHTQWKYIQQLPSVLKSGGRALLHTANICSDKGFERFSRQDEASVGGFCFSSPEIVFKMVKQVPELSIVCHSLELPPGVQNIYVQRDFLI